MVNPGLGPEDHGDQRECGVGTRSQSGESSDTHLKTKELLEQKFGVLDRSMTTGRMSRSVCEFDVGASLTRTVSLCEQSAASKSDFVAKTLPEIREKVLRKRSQISTVRALSTIAETEENSSRR